MVSVLAFIVAKFSLQDFKQTMLKYFVASFLGCFRITEMLAQLLDASNDIDAALLKKAQTTSAGCQVTTFL